MKTILAGMLTVCLSGCTAVQVKAPDDLASISNVCIVKNPAVIVDDFVDVVRSGFSRHHIATTVVDEADAKGCEVTMTYTARRSWDMAPYLSKAELHLWRGGVEIGSADYHLRGKGGYSLMKWQGTKTKMDPVIDQLLQKHS